MKDNTSTFDSVKTDNQNQSVNDTVKRDGPRLLNFIRKRISDADDAEDILQDVFYQLVQAQRLMNPIGEVTAWLYTVARNKITDSFRKKKTESLDKQLNLGEEAEEEMFNLMDLLPAETDPAEVAMLRSYIMEELETAMNELPKEQREIFMLHEIDGKSFNEISEMKGVGVNTLISRKRYAVLYLRERLRDLYDELLID
jgi:RNA polymerase sigma factor (sigma-70 family)